MKCVNLQQVSWAMCVFAFATQLAYAQTPSIDSESGLFAAPKHGGARRWQVVNAAGTALRDAAQADANIVTDFPQGAVLNSFGCSTGADGMCDVRALHGGARGFVPAGDLGPIEGPDGVIAVGINDSARRAKRKRYDATGQVSCAQEQGQALTPCPFGVARSTGGDVTAAVTFDTGFTRLLFFMHGEFISAAATMSGAGRDTDWVVVDGLHIIRADDQRFEIPHSLLFGE